MGVADLVPGISGGTIALITGVYQGFIKSLSYIIQKKTLKLLIGFQFKKLYHHLDGHFFFSLVFGILTSIFLFAHVVSYVYVKHPIALWSFFLGLILASTIFLMKEAMTWSPRFFIFLSTGIVVAWMATGGVPIRPSEGLFSIFVAGLIAISAMLLPGISGSFLLILMGKYYVMLEATKNLDFTVIFVFGLGCVISLVLFSKILNWLIKNYWHISLALLTGFLIGSMHKLWPWRETITTYVSSSGSEKPLIQKSISPWQYEYVSGQDPQLLLAIVFLTVGFTTVFVLEKVKNKNRFN